MEIIVYYQGGSNIITGVLIKGGQEDKNRGKSSKKGSKDQRGEKML